MYCISTKNIDIAFLLCHFLKGTKFTELGDIFAKKCFKLGLFGYDKDINGKKITKKK